MAFIKGGLHMLKKISKRHVLLVNVYIFFFDLILYYKVRWAFQYLYWTFDTNKWHVLNLFLHDCIDYECFYIYFVRQLGGNVMRIILKWLLYELSVLGHTLFRAIGSYRLVYLIMYVKILMFTNYVIFKNIMFATLYLFGI